MPRHPIGDLRKRRMVEVLREVAVGARTLEWFEGKVPARDEGTEEATSELLRIGLIERLEGYPEWEKHPFRLTDRGHSFLENLVGRIGGKGIGCSIDIDWKRIDEIEFPLIGNE